MESFGCCNTTISLSAPYHSQQPCTSEGFDHFCFRSGIEIHVSDGVLNDAPGDGEPFLACCRAWQVVYFKNLCLLDVIKDVGHG
jgi:hypothetical protein